jgi:hypothetical protein
LCGETGCALSHAALVVDQRGIELGVALDLRFAVAVGARGMLLTADDVEDVGQEEVANRPAGGCAEGADRSRIWRERVNEYAQPPGGELAAPQSAEVDAVEPEKVGLDFGVIGAQ